MASHFSIYDKTRLMSDGLITIVVPTHDRPHLLTALLESIQKYRTPEIDSIVVVDDSENPVDLNGKFPDLKIKHVAVSKAYLHFKGEEHRMEKCKD